MRTPYNNFQRCSFLFYAIYQNISRGVLVKLKYTLVFKYTFIFLQQMQIWLQINYFILYALILVDIKHTFCNKFTGSCHMCKCYRSASAEPLYTTVVLHFKFLGVLIFTFKFQNRCKYLIKILL